MFSKGLEEAQSYSRLRWVGRVILMGFITSSVDYISRKIEKKMSYSATSDLGVAFSKLLLRIGPRLDLDTNESPISGAG